MRKAIDKTKNVPIMKKVIKVFTILPPSYHSCTKPSSES